MPGSDTGRQPAPHYPHKEPFLRNDLQAEVDSRDNRAEAVEAREVQQQQPFDQGFPFDTLGPRELLGGLGLLQFLSSRVAKLPAEFAQLALQFIESSSDVIRDDDRAGCGAVLDVVVHRGPRRCEGKVLSGWNVRSARIIQRLAAAADPSFPPACVSLPSPLARASLLPWGTTTRGRDR